MDVASAEAAKDEDVVAEIMTALLTVTPVPPPAVDEGTPREDGDEIASFVDHVVVHFNENSSLVSQEAVEMVKDFIGVLGASADRLMIVAEIDGTVDFLEQFVQRSMSQARIHALSYLLQRLGFPRESIEWIIKSVVGDEPRAGAVGDVKVFLNDDILPDTEIGEADL